MGIISSYVLCKATKILRYQNFAELNITLMTAIKSQEKLALIMVTLYNLGWYKFCENS